MHEDIQEMISTGSLYTKRHLFRGNLTGGDEVLCHLTACWYHSVAGWPISIELVTFGRQVYRLSVTGKINFAAMQKAGNMCTLRPLPLHLKGGDLSRWGVLHRMFLPPTQRQV